MIWDGLLLVCGMGLGIAGLNLLVTWALWDAISEPDPGTIETRPSGLLDLHLRSIDERRVQEEEAEAGWHRPEVDVTWDEYEPID